MLRDRTRLERTLKTAEQQLSAWETALTKAGVEESARRLDPTWRKLSAIRRQVRQRIRAVAGVEKREADALQRKADKAAGVTADSGSDE